MSEGAWGPVHMERPGHDQDTDQDTPPTKSGVGAAGGRACRAAAPGAR